MKDTSSFIRRLFNNRTTAWLLSLYGVWGFATTIADQFFPSFSEKLKAAYLLPKWHWRTWLIIGLGIFIIVLLDGAHAIWKEKETLTSASTGDAPQLILDYEPSVTDSPRRREGSWIVRNAGLKAAVNVLVEPFAIGKHGVTCDPVNRLLPSDTAKLTCEVRSGDDIRKPCLLWLERLFEVELRDKNVDQQTPIPLTIRYGDLTGRKYLVEYSLTYRVGINEVLAEFKKIDITG
jgi:hypothetical protein